MGDNKSGGQLKPFGQQEPTAPKQMTPEEIKALQDQIALQQKQLDLRQKTFEQGPELTYNPIVETTGPDGKKTIGLREELQLRGPEEFIKAEEARQGLSEAQALDQMNRQMMQQQAQQRATAASRGGLRGGTGAMDRYSMREALLAKQGITGQSMKQRAELASQAEQLRTQAREKQVGLLGGAIKDVEKFNLDRWMKQKEVEAAKAQAQATREAGGSGGKK
jgi:hypothetical protein